MHLLRQLRLAQIGNIQAALALPYPVIHRPQHKIFQGQGHRPNKEILRRLHIGRHPCRHLLTGHLAVQLTLHCTGQVFQRVAPQPGVNPHIHRQGEIAQRGAPQHPPQVNRHRDLRPAVSLVVFCQCQHRLEHYRRQKCRDGAMMPMRQRQQLLLRNGRNNQMEKAVLLPRPPEPEGVLLFAAQGGFPGGSREQIRLLLRRGSSGDIQHSKARRNGDAMHQGQVRRRQGL